MRLRFELAGVPLELWKDKQERLGRFFAKDLQAELISPTPELLDLMLVPKKNDKEHSGKDELN